MVALSGAIGAELAAVALPAVLRPIDEDTRAGGGGAGAEAAEPVGAHDLQQRPRGGGREVSDHVALIGPVPHDPVAAGTLEPRQRAGRGRHGVENACCFVLVGRLEDAAQAIPNVLDRGELGRAGHTSRARPAYQVQEAPQIRLGGEMLGRIVIGVPRVEKGDGEVDAGLLRITDDHGTRIPRD